MLEFTLNNENKIPSIGFGTWHIKGEEAEKIILTAIDCGYRHIDTASKYDNEVCVGNAIVKSGISRDDFFLTSKLWNLDKGYNETLKAFDRTLNNLQVNELDLFLIHWPITENTIQNWSETNHATWEAMEKLYHEKKIKNIGVSNFKRHHLEKLLSTVDVKPVINQIEFHPRNVSKRYLRVLQSTSHFS